MALLVVGTSFQPRAQAAAVSPVNVAALSQDIQIDKALFFASIPSYAVIGQNYSVKLVVTNTSNQSIPIIIAMHSSLGAVSITPFQAQLVIGPGKQVSGNFSLIPVNSAPLGPVNVSATVSIWFLSQMPRPQVAQKVSTLIYGIEPYPYAPVIIGASVLIILASVVVVVQHLRRSRRQVSAPLSE